MSKDNDAVKFGELEKNHPRRVEGREHSARNLSGHLQGRSGGEGGEG